MRDPRQTKIRRAILTALAVIPQGFLLPQDTQSITPSWAATSKLSLRMKAAISTGTSPQGQMVTQVPQRMQGLTGCSFASLPGWAVAGPSSARR